MLLVLLTLVGPFPRLNVSVNVVKREIQMQHYHTEMVDSIMRGSRRVVKFCPYVHTLSRSIY